MSVTTRLVRFYFRVLVALVIALNGYLLATGVAALARVSPPKLSIASTARTVAAGSAPNDASIILERNPFDSTNRPLPVSALPVPRLLPPPADPLRAPICAELVVLATAQFDNPWASTALVRLAGEPRGSVRRVGDRVGNGVVAYIGRNPLTPGPTVWFEDGTRLCQAHVFRPSARAPRSANQPAIDPAPQRSDRSFPRELARRIRKLSPSLVQVDRSAFGTLLEEYPRLTRGARLRVTREQGVPVGVRVHKIRSNGLLAHLGFKPRDRIERLNGRVLSSPGAIRTELSRASAASQIQFQVTRNGQPMVIELAIR